MPWTSCPSLSRYRTIRGRTLLATIFDEVAMWQSDESANPDSEVYSAVLPSLIRTQGLLVVISTGYRRAGLLYDKWRAHFGSSGDPGIRNVQAGSMPCTVNFAKLEKPLPEGLTRRVGASG
jgi:hypothetical protein